MIGVAYQVKEFIIGAIEDGAEYDIVLTLAAVAHIPPPMGKLLPFLPEVIAVAEPFFQFTRTILAQEWGIA